MIRFQKNITFQIEQMQKQFFAFPNVFTTFQEYEDIYRILKNYYFKMEILLPMDIVHRWIKICEMECESMIDEFLVLENRNEIISFYLKIVQFCGKYNLKIPSLVIENYQQKIMEWNQGLDMKEENEEENEKTWDQISDNEEMQS